MGRWPSLAERLWSKIDVGGPDECWPWTGHLDHEGYGRIRVGDKRRRVHRLVYQSGATIPEGNVPDHTCRNRACCNPAHIEPVTNAENVLRGVGPTAINATKTHCPQGHPYNTENTYFTKKGYRMCRTCNAEREARRPKRKR